MMDYSEDRRIIKQAIADNKLIVFAGAGVSANSGVPLWKDAVKKIYERIGSTAIDKNDTLKIPQIYYNIHGEKEYNELVKDIFRYDDKNPNEIHKLIVKMKPCHVITTNYDDFLERAFNENGEFLYVVQKDSEIPYCKNSRMIIKMHGGFIYNNFVLKEDDYLNYSRNFALIETLVKALVAKDIILFIGYAYNDPDTKQIFNWVKNILGNNFQRAYILDAHNNFDLYTMEYYKNLGVNIIYASEYIKEKFNNEDIYGNTIKLLKYIIDDEQETDIVDIAYNKFKYLAGLNYILIQYISPALRNLNIMYSKEDSSLTLLSDKSKRIFEAFDKDESIKLSTIKSVLNKTIIKNVYIRDDKSNDKTLLYSFKNIAYDKFYEDIDNQNYINIKNYSESVGISAETDNQRQLCIAYGFYELQDYQKCYEILKRVSLSYKQHQNYIWYFISEFNRLHVGNLISKRIYWNTNNELKNEVQKIDLSDILYNNALMGKNENEFLKELEDFTLMYETLSNVLEIYEKVQKDVNTNYVFGAGTSNIDILENYIRDFYDYIKLNHLMIDQYSEVKVIYIQYIKAVFYSHSKKEKEFKNDIFGPGKNKVLKEISPFAITIICKYIDTKHLDELLEDNCITKITLSNNAENKLFEILNNYFNSIENKIIIKNIKDKIFVVLRILSLSSFSHERMKWIIDKINTLMNQKYFIGSDYYNISNFIVDEANSNRNILDSDSLILLINTICNGFKLGIMENSSPNYLQILFGSICAILHNLFPDEKINDNYSNDILESNHVEFLPDLFLVASDDIKSKIKSHILSRLKNNKFDYKLYCDCIYKKIIEESKDMEDILFEEVKEFYDHKKPREYRPDLLETILNCCISLYLNGKLIDKERFEPYFKSFPKIEFLYDMSNFDYSKFDLSWFTNANDALKKVILQNKTAFKEIKRLYIKALKDNDYNQKTISDYVQYFDKVE